MTRFGGVCEACRRQQCNRMYCRLDRPMGVLLAPTSATTRTAHPHIVVQGRTWRRLKKRRQH